MYIHSKSHKAVSYTHRLNTATTCREQSITHTFMDGLFLCNIIYIVLEGGRERKKEREDKETTKLNASREA